MDIGERIRRIRVQRGLTQQELANRCELTKGFISQLECNLTSPSIATLTDILGSLGVSLKDFFTEQGSEKTVFTVSDVFVKEDEKQGTAISWLIPNAQKNQMEPILLALKPKCSATTDDPHEGEEFGYVLSGVITLVLGEQRERVRKGESFYFKPTAPHTLINNGKTEARVLWVASPPTF